MNLDVLQEWVGRERRVTAVLAVETANLLAATLDRPPAFGTGDRLPPAWHWLYFHEATRASQLGLEGHAQLGGFMPPVSFGGPEPPRRMWAGGELHFQRPLLLGETATQRSTIRSITPKEGRSGRLVFVVVSHEISVAGEVRLSEEQTIVYREPVAEAGGGGEAPSAPAGGEFGVEYRPDPILLFRYSALTFNAHRIHYDVDYCRQQEGYPDLVVHGPLTATLLLDLFYHQFPEQELARFSYRGISPLFNPHPFTVNGRANGEAWATSHDGHLAMRAQIQFADPTGSPTRRVGQPLSG
ncbi:MAG: MaoC family dehydratase N-terminal domain-containing protein [Anaerolineales bacterium]|nr:MaoC family dehydratase N-terminal domain-containing protein [Anaerolineales bacterium]